jgi:hypothetical protein
MTTFIVIRDTVAIGKLVEFNRIKKKINNSNNIVFSCIFLLLVLLLFASSGIYELLTHFG